MLVKVGEGTVVASPYSFCGSVDRRGSVGSETSVKDSSLGLIRKEKVHQFLARIKTFATLHSLLECMYKQPITSLQRSSAACPSSTGQMHKTACEQLPDVL